MAETVIREYTTEPADMQAFKNSGYYQSMGLDALQKMVDQYTQGEDALRAEAEAQYRPTYEREIEAIRQARDTQEQGYRQQISYLFIDEADLALGVLKEDLFAAVEEILQNRKPRPKTESIFAHGLGMRIGIQGAGRIFH